MKKADNFFKTLANLKLIEGKQPPYDVITLAGMISLYQLCFEQAWKAMKEWLEAEGISERLGSPRMVLKCAYAAGLIEDETIWLAALAARNESAHSYNENVALAVIKEVQEHFISMFDALAARLKEGSGA